MSHPAIEAAVSFWCNEIHQPDGIPVKQLTIFKTSILAAISGAYNSAEGVVVVHSIVSKDVPGGFCREPGKPSGIIRNALKKSRLRADLLPLNVVMTIGVHEIKVYRYGAAESISSKVTPQVIWRAPERPWRGRPGI